MRPGLAAMTCAAMLAALGAAAGCEQAPGEQSAAEQALAELQARYEALKARQDTDPVEWAKGDLENIGDWEYRILELSAESVADLEDALNAAGDDRWEAFWVSESEAGLIVFLKRPSVSYISRVPFSQLGRFIGGDDGAR